MAQPWKVLHLEHDSIPPRLLVKTRLDSSGYTIKFTDLSRIWAETLTKREIETRAITSDCAIDPRDGEDQYKILLDKIRDALEQSEGTTLSIRTANDKKSGEGNMVLSLFAILPSPLPEFHWDINLSPLPQDYVESELVTPLFQHANTLQGQIQTLIAKLHDKDRVISKITDRLETSGNDLTTVFPGVRNVKVSLKKSQRDQLARHVKGLADFDEDAWRARDGVANDVAKVGLEQINDILAALPDVASRERDDNGEWWKQLGEGGFSTYQASNKKPAATKHSRQRSKVPPPPHDDESTEDEDDLDAPQRESQSSQRSFQTKQRASNPGTSASQPKQLCAVDGRNRTVSPEEATSEEIPASSPAKPRSKLGAIGGRSKTSATPEPTPEPAPSPAKPCSKLGTIGGKSKPSASRASEATSSATLPATSQKLGVIGGKKRDISAGLSASRAASEDTAASDGLRASPKPQSRAADRKLVKEATPPPLETEEERANRKRDKLRRQLEEKAKAPVKKKRKF